MTPKKARRGLLITTLLAALIAWGVSEVSGPEDPEAIHFSTPVGTLEQGPVPAPEPPPSVTRREIEAASKEASIKKTDATPADRSSALANPGFTGWVTDESGRPARDLVLAFYNRNREETVTAVPDEAGHYQASGMVPDTYLLSIRRTQPAVEIERRDVLLERPGQPLDLIVANTGRISGCVRDPSGNPLKATLVVTPADRFGGATVAYSSPHTGLYEFSGVTAGNYRVVARADGRARTETQVQVRPHESVLTDMMLEPGGSIRGRITNPTGEPAVAKLKLLRVEKQFLVSVNREWHTREDGSFHLNNLDLGEYRLKVLPEDHAWTVRDVTLDQNCTDPQLDISLTPGASLAGQNFTAASHGEGGRMVMRFLSPEHGLRVVALPVSDDGHYHLPSIPPGPCEVQARWNDRRLETSHIFIEGQTQRWDLRFEP